MARILDGVLRPPSFAQEQELLDAVEEAAQALCPRYGLQPDDCVKEAARTSNWGRHVVGNNWWELQGTGSAGFITTLTLRKRKDGQHGGWDKLETQLAKFASPRDGVQAWCESQEAA